MADFLQTIGTMWRYATDPRYRQDLASDKRYKVQRAQERQKFEQSIGEFSGTRLTRADGKEIEIARIQGDLARLLIKEYHEATEEFDDPNLGYLTQDIKYSQGLQQIRRSSIVSQVILNQILNSRGLRTADLADLEATIAHVEQERKEHPDFPGKEDLAFYHAVPGIVLRNRNTKGDNTRPLYEQLIKQIQTEFPEINTENPIVIPAYSLEIYQDPNSAYKMAFKIKPDSTVLETPQFSDENNQRTFNHSDSNGIPDLSQRKGWRTLKTYNTQEDLGLNQNNCITSIVIFGDRKLHLEDSDFCRDIDVANSHAIFSSGGDRGGTIYIVRDAA